MQAACRRRMLAGQSVVTGPLQRAGHGRALERSRYDAEQSIGAQQPGNRQGERAFGHRRKIRKATVIDLLLAADFVEFDDLDVVRIGEIGDRRIVEGDVAVDADPRQTMSIGAYRATRHNVRRRRAARAPARSGGTVRTARGRTGVLRSQRAKRCGASAARPIYSSMWNAVTRRQSIPASATSASIISAWLGAAAKIIRTPAATASLARISAATSTGRRPGPWRPALQRKKRAAAPPSDCAGAGAQRQFSHTDFSSRTRTGNSVVAVACGYDGRYYYCNRLRVKTFG